MGVGDKVILFGALAGGFVSGLTGFGTGLTAMPFWLTAVTPTVAAPLVVVCSIVAQLQTLPYILRSFDWRQSISFVAGGLFGLPAGTALLALIPVTVFKLLIGLSLVLYCGYGLLRKAPPPAQNHGPAADGFVGFGGGIAGGLAGLSGPLPTLWINRKAWKKIPSVG